MTPTTASNAIELIKKDLGKEPSYHEEIALLQEKAVLPKEKTEKLLKEIKEEVPGKNEELYIKIVDVLPKKVETLRLILYHLGEELSEEEERKILSLVEKYLE